MLDTSSSPTGPAAEGASCTMRAGGCSSEQSVSGSGLLSGGCCPQDAGPAASQTHMGRAARRSRAAAGLMFLAIAGGLASRRLPGRIALWPASLIPTWFGVSHLLAGVTGYQGCPELGAIPSVLLGRPVSTSCELWRRIDRWVQRSDAQPVPCC
jgi:hypothetical protein